MEHLLTLIRRKRVHDGLVLKEGRGLAPFVSSSMAMASPAPSLMPTRVCWLCGHDAPLRFRLKDTSALCFGCFHAAYVALVLPVLNNARRRACDGRLVARIEALRASASTEDEKAFPITEEERETEEEEDEDDVDKGGGRGTTAAEQPSLLGLSRRQRHATEAATSKREGPGLANAPRMNANNTAWYLGGVTACTFCGVDLSGLYTSLVFGTIEQSFCRNKEMHIVWRCRVCSTTNPTEGDYCYSCKKPRLWSCKYCTALHEIQRSVDGLRYCPTCRNYNSPEDIFLGQTTIDMEQEMAKRMATYDQVCSEMGVMGNVVFGVNDAGTLLEVERQQEIEANTYRLKCRLEKLQIKCSPQKDDGNCLFAALAHQLFGKAHLHNIIRSCVVAYMSENESDYGVFFNGKKEWRQYLSDMRKSGFWGDEICINAAARCFCVDIHVITSDATRWHLVFQHNQLGSSKSKSRRKTSAHNSMGEVGLNASDSCPHKNAATAENVICLFLLYTSPVHFDDIESSEAPCITLSDLLIPELYRLMQLEGKKTIPPRPPLTRAARKISSAPIQSADNQKVSKHSKNHDTHINSLSINSSVASTEDGMMLCGKSGLPQHASDVSVLSIVEVPGGKGYETISKNASNIL